MIRRASLADEVAAFAAQRGDVGALLQLLTDGQVSARGRGHEGRPLLAVAAAAGRAPAVELLLKHSADVDAPDRRFGSGATPLVLASVHGHTSVVEIGGAGRRGLPRARRSQPLPCKRSSHCASRTPRWCPWSLTPPRCQRRSYRHGSSRKAVCTVCPRLECAWTVSQPSRPVTFPLPSSSMRCEPSCKVAPTRVRLKALARLRALPGRAQLLLRPAIYFCSEGVVQEVAGGGRCVLH